jgi:tetratricopeptide (TPR) repeat protein
VANAAVALHRGTPPPLPDQVTYTDAEGRYRFTALRSGGYDLRADKSGYDQARAVGVNLAPRKSTTVDLIVAPAKASAQLGPAAADPKTERPGPQAPEFFDEPQFTVAGVTEGSNLGGHGSDTVRRTTEALARATASLSKESAKQSSAASMAPTSAALETSLRGAATREPASFDANWRLGRLLADDGRPAEAVAALEAASRLNPGNAEVHHLLGEVEEKLRHPLQAVREFERAATLDPSEANLFDWGTELLTHRALEPATEVFTRGQRLFPKSERMLLALGAAWYARGSCDQASQFLAGASDLDPTDPTPYLYLGRMQSAETAPIAGAVERLAHFAQIEPQNALANYYYALSLFKQSQRQSPSAAEAERDGGPSASVESLLQKAVRLDPKLSPAYLQLGIVYAERTDFSRAISAFQTAIVVSTSNAGADDIGSPSAATLEEAHYRLAQAYMRTGDKPKAQEELKLNAQIAEKIKEKTEQDRSEIQAFIISLRQPDSSSRTEP